MKREMLVGIAVMCLAACQSRPPVQQPVQGQTSPAVPEETSPPNPPPEDTSAVPAPVTNADVANTIPPCLPEAPKPKLPVKRKPRPAQGTEKPVAVETQPPRLGSTTPEVKPIDTSVASILGKRVQSSEGEDLGRVVDVHADGSGRVRLVIIEFGGFLGVGNRRAAVDWSLLRFHPDDPEQPISLSVNAKQVQATPEYRQASHPKALMAPAPAAPAAEPATAPPPTPQAPTNPAPPQTK
jgi:PRC-barrel domain